MHFTTGTTLPWIGKHNWQLVMLAGGLAVAISAVAITGGFDRGNGAASTAPQPQQPPVNAAPASSSAYRQLTSPEMVFYLVNSDAEARMLESAFSSEAASIPTNIDRAVVVAKTAEQEADFQSMFGLASVELAANDIGLSIVDLRDDASAGVPTVYVVGSEAEKALLERGMSAQATNASIFVIEKGTLSGDNLYNTIVGEQMEAGNFEVVDLRQ
jgi:hypothetical protein